jgi:hypothetical protein
MSSAERLDLPDLLSIDSYSAGDWQYFLKTIVGEDTPYIIKGFDIINPAATIGTQNCSINIADSAMYYPGSGAGSFYYGLPAGNPNAQPLVPELRKNATNYLYLVFTTLATAEDARAFWDPDANGGVGSEFTQEVNTESVIQVQVNVSTGSFPDNTVPIAIVNVGPSVITSIEDARPLMFRLGTGGVSPNPSARFAWPAIPDAAHERQETPITINSPIGLNPFQGGDKNLTSLKEWMDAVMTKLAELGGTQYWYEDASAFSIVNIFHDALATTFKSKGQYLHSSVTPGQLTYTEDVLILSASDPREYILRAGVIQIPNEYVAYLDLIRAQPINTLNEAVSWTNSQPYVNTPNGSIGFFANLNQGDWITKVGDDPTEFLRVEQFYDSANLGGSVTTPANAKSIRLSAAYQGTTSTDVAAYDKGVYLSTDILIQPRTDAAITAAGGDFLWLALRSDVIEGIASVVSTTLSGTLTTGNGSTAEIVSTAHGLINGDVITVTAPAAYAGTYTVEVADVNTFFIGTTVTSAGGAFTGYYALLTTAATTNGYGLQLESADHGFETGEEIIISNTTNWNGSYVVSYRTATEVEIAAPSALATETSGNATLARMDVRTERGITKVVQGEIIDIGENDSKNIQSYIGMLSLAETSPTYFIPTGYNTFYNAANYNGASNDNLTLRASQLTAMMADKAQDKTIKYLTNATSVTNTTSSAAQQITFQQPGSTLTILQPGSSGNAVITLPSSGAGISLLVNQSAYVYINRNAATTPSIIVANTSNIPIDENIIVIATRLSDASIYLWNGENLIDFAVLTPSYPALIKVNFYDPVSTTLPVGNPVTEDGFSVTAGDLVLFSNLASGNNEIYIANGTGTNVTGWTLQYLFNGSSVPTGADTVIVQQGNGFANQIGTFNGTTWTFNFTVRYFNGTDYFEQDAIFTTTLTDNTTNGTVFSIGATGSEYMVIDFSLNRGTARETGTLYVTSDGTNVSIATDGAYLNASGITFTGTITGSNLVVQYTTTSTGSNGTMKLMIRRWSNAPGGPSGVPSYSATASAGLAGGANEDVQFNNSGVLDGNANFQWDSGNEAVVLGGLQQVILQTGNTIVNNSTGALFQYPAATYPFAVIEYSIVRNGVFSLGRLLVANDTHITAQSYDFVQTNTVGVTLSSTIVGANVVVSYTASATGFNGVFKYSMRRWS